MAKKKKSPAQISAASMAKAPLASKMHGHPKPPTLKQTVPTRASESTFLNRTSHPSVIKARLRGAAGHSTKLADIKKSQRVFVGPVTIKGDSASSMVGREPGGTGLINTAAAKRKKEQLARAKAKRK